MFKVTLDVSDLERGIKKFVDQAIKEIKRAGYESIAEHTFTALQQESPQAPLDAHNRFLHPGLLQSSGSAFVDNEFISASNPVGPYADPATSSDVTEKELLIGYNTSYAARWHEEYPPSREFSNPLADIKYLERQVQSDKTMQAFADGIKKLGALK